MPSSTERSITTPATSSEATSQGLETPPALPESASQRLHPIRELGRGGSGTVWLVHDTERGDYLALKRIVERNPDELRRFKRAFRALCALHHPNLVRLHEIGADAEGFYLLMEPVCGTDFLTYVRASGGLDHQASRPLGESTQKTEELIHPNADYIGPEEDEVRPVFSGVSAFQLISPRLRADAPSINVERLRHVMPQLLAGLRALHERGHVHRDLKPDNILIDTEGRLKLVDFGIVTEAGKADMGHLCGTIGYVPPEALRGEPPSVAFDIYALGVILYRVFAGRPPFQGEGQQVLRQMFRAPPRSLSSVAPWTPKVIASLVDRMLSITPTHRPRLDELEEKLSAPGRGRHVASRATSPVSHPVDTTHDDAEAVPRQVWETLERLPNARVRLTVLEGSEGGGEDRIMRCVAQRVRDSGALVFEGMGRHADRVPFGAFDDIIDQLGSHLGHVPDDRWTLAARDAVHRAATLFPSLRRPDYLPPARLPSRAAIFVDLAHLLQWVGGEDGVLLLIRGFHLFDDDAHQLLRTLLGSDVVGVQVVATIPGNPFVMQGSASAHLSDLTSASNGAVVSLPLEKPSVSSLARIIRRHASREIPEGLLEAVALSCHGMPLLAEFAGLQFRRVSTLRDVESVWESHVRYVWRKLEHSERDLVTVLLAAARPLRIDRACACIGTPLGKVYAAIDSLAPQLLVERSGGALPDTLIRFGVSVFHDAWEKTAGAGRMERAYGQLAKHGGDDAGFARVRYLDGAGRPAEAAEVAIIAAGKAMERGAFGLAADLYAYADPISPLLATELRKWGACCEASGRYDDAVHVWRRLEETLRNQPWKNDRARREALRLVHYQHAAALLADGRQEAAIATLEREETFPQRRMRMGFSAARFFMGVSPGRAPRRRRRGATPIPSAADTRDLAHATIPLDHTRFVRLGVVLTYFDFFRGLQVLMEAVRVGREASDGSEAFALLPMAYIASHANRRQRGLDLALQYREEAREASELLSVEWRRELNAWESILEAHLLQRSGRWEEAAAHFAEQDRLLKAGRPIGPFERVVLKVHHALSIYCLQDVARLQSACENLQSFFSESGVRSLSGHADIMCAALAHLQGKRDEAAARVAHWRHESHARPSGPVDANGRIMACLYHEGELTNKHIVDLRRAFDQGIRYQFHRRSTAPFITGPAALLEVRAVRLGLAQASARRVRQLAGATLEAPPMAYGSAYRALAYLADEEGNRDEAMRLLRKAEHSATHYRQPLDAEIARWQIARRESGPSAIRRMREAELMLEQAGSCASVADEDPGAIEPPS